MSNTIPTSEVKQQLISFLQTQRDSAVNALAHNPGDSEAQSTAYLATRWIKWIAVKATRADVISYYYEYRQNVESVETASDNSMDSEAIDATAQAIASVVTTAIDNAQAIEIDPDQMSMF